MADIFSELMEEENRRLKFANNMQSGKIADLERQLAECKAAHERQRMRGDNWQRGVLRIQAERDSLACQITVVEQERDAAYLCNDEHETARDILEDRLLKSEQARQAAERGVEQLREVMAHEINIQAQESGEIDELVQRIVMRRSARMRKALRQTDTQEPPK